MVPSFTCSNWEEKKKLGRGLENGKESVKGSGEKNHQGEREKGSRK
jgi:hypothetical protein